MEVVGGAYRGGIAQRDCGLDGAYFAMNACAKTFPGVYFCLRRRFVFSFHDDRRTPNGGNQHIAVLPGVVNYGLGLFGSHLATGQHGL